MNKFLLLQAINQSNLHPTTKSFLSSVLKNMEEGKKEDKEDKKEFNEWAYDTTAETDGKKPFHQIEDDEY